MARDLGKFRELASNWEALGRSDPFFGVLSDPTKQFGRWDPAEFFGSGSAHVHKLFRILDDLGVTFEPGTCLDFGCGVGRLTIPLSASFSRTVGVDVAPSMIKTARAHVPPDHRCEFVVNRAPHLRQFPGGSFDFVHSCLVLQHVPPAVTLGYISEFFRVCRRGGLVVFQIPAATISEEAVSATHALPESGYSAAIECLDPPSRLRPGTATPVRVAVLNTSPATWKHDIPAGRHITVANHWLTSAGQVAVPDDGRARLPADVPPGGRMEADLIVRAPAAAGDYVLEIDLVQERICWFAERGSPTARIPIRVDGTPEPAVEAPPVEVRERSMLVRIANRFRKGTPTFEMHTVPRADIEQAIAASGGRLLHAIDDNAAGERWLSYTYVSRKEA
jgi:SAM-dependent methyltransferase